jgi:p-hydroxybenzoate 3-monooxygenase
MMPPIVRHTDVVIVGAGPAGLVLSHLLTARDIDCVVVEQRDRDYVEHRLRAGVLEQPTVDLLRALGVADRLDREGMEHTGVQLAFEGRRHHIDFVELTGRAITVYGQQEVVKDLIAARLAAGGEIVFEALDVEPIDVTADRPGVRYRLGTEHQELRGRIIAGCDGFHGVCRAAVPGLQIVDHTYPFAWLGILADAAPSQEELIYSNHEDGFALYSMRTPAITRLYLQVPADTDLAAWSDDRIWDELGRRLPTSDGFTLNTGPIVDRGLTAMRSFVAAPMRHGNLVLAGDAAHIVPPTGAKGMNLAIADVAVLADVLTDVFDGEPERLDDYTPSCMRRVWRAQHFSWWMTSLTHRISDDPFQRQLQLSELRLVTGSRAAATSLAENYVGLPWAALADGG